MTLNPRGRDTIAQTPHATRPAVLPALPPPTSEFERSVKAILDARTGGPNPFDRWMTMRELEELGLRGTVGVETTSPRDLVGIPVWVSRGRFIPVSLSAQAASLQQYLTLTNDSNDEELTQLRRRIASIPRGITNGELEAAINTLTLQLGRRWRADIGQALGDAGLEGIEETRVLAENTAETVERQRSKTIAFESATVWTVAHELHRFPAVTVLNAAGEKIEPDVEYVDADEIVVTHGRATAGTVLLT